MVEVCTVLGFNWPSSGAGTAFTTVSSRELALKAFVRHCSYLAVLADSPMVTTAASLFAITSPTTPPPSLSTPANMSEGRPIEQEYKMVDAAVVQFQFCARE